MTRQVDVPVLIVGAGPVGLALAIDLGWRGVGCLVIEASADSRGDVDALPRAAAIAPRTMEFCRRWGFAHRVTNAGFPREFTPNNTYLTALDGHLIFKHEFDSMEDRKPLEVSPEFRERCPQTWFDPILAEEAARFGHVSSRGATRLDSFVDNGDHVVARVTSDGTSEVITCRYLVACDGSSSTVRSQLGVESDGAGNLTDSLSTVLRLPDFLSRHPFGAAERYMFYDETGRWAVLTVIDGRERWRFDLTRAAGDVGGEPGQHRLRGFIERALGPDIPYEIVSSGRWRRKEQIARRFRVGNVLLAGDAAHVIPPNLGLGMNTGVGDSVDLGWKLDAVLAGWGGEHLLDSYELERRPVAVRNANESTRAHRVSQRLTKGHPNITASGSDGDQARALVGEGLRRELGAGWMTLNLQLGYRYDDSPIVVPDGTAVPDGDDDIGVYHQTARPGARAPHVWLGEGRSTIDWFGHGFVLLRTQPDVAVDTIVAAAAKAGLPLRVVDEVSPDVADAYEAVLTLVRPDGHVAWRSDTPAHHPTELIDTIRGATSPTEKDR